MSESDAAYKLTIHEGIEVTEESIHLSELSLATYIQSLIAGWFRDGVYTSQDMDSIPDHIRRGIARSWNLHPSFLIGAWNRAACALEEADASLVHRLECAPITVTTATNGTEKIPCVFNDNGSLAVRSAQEVALADERSDVIRLIVQHAKNLNPFAPITQNSKFSEICHDRETFDRLFLGILQGFKQDFVFNMSMTISDFVNQNIGD